MKQLKLISLKGNLTFEGKKVSHRKLHCQAKYFHCCLSLGLQHAHKLLGPDTTSWGSLHEGSKYRRCQEIPKWLSKHQERPADRVKKSYCRAYTLFFLVMKSYSCIQIKFMFHFTCNYMSFQVGTTNKKVLHIMYRKSALVYWMQSFYKDRPRKSQHSRLFLNRK